jgi:dipeptidyl aminopeptidase/acylaminoacyl peptidase
MPSPHSWRRARSAFPFVACVIRRPVVLLMLVACAAVSRGAAPAPVGPTVQDVVEFTRIIQPRNEEQDELRAQTSPDGQRAFIVTRRGDVRTDKNHFEILLLDLGAASLEAQPPAAPQRVLSIEAGEDNNYADPSLQNAAWVGNQTIVMRARLHDAPFQVFKLDVNSRQLTQLTHDARGVVSFSISSDLSRVVYAAQVPNPPMPAGERSIVVGTNSFWSIKHGQNDTRSQQRRYQFMVAESGSHAPARPLGEPFSEGGGYVPGVSISPDGSWALVPRYEPDRQLAWGQQYPLVADATARMGPAVTIDPLRYFSRANSWVPRRFVAYRLADGREQPVIDAPDDAMAGLGQVRSDRLWQRDGRSVVIAGTHLPMPAGGSGSAPWNSGSHIIEYWPASGNWAVIASLNGRLQAAHTMVGPRDSFVAIDDERRRYFERQADGRWQELDRTGLAEVTNGATAAAQRGTWSLRVEAGPNQPPDVVAVGPEGRTVRLTDLNPKFSAATWGRMRGYEWTDAEGRLWKGGLMVPSGFDASARHALVIQTYGFSPSRFYLDGANGADGYTSGFAGRAFLRENILVLAMPVRPSTGAPSGEAAAIAGFADGVHGAIRALVNEGLVDRERIGIMGWSATGERVLNLVTFSDAPIRAASIMDGDANTLFSMTVTYGAGDGILARKERTNQGRPFGETLQRWVRNDPALNTECVRAALRIETYGPWVLNNWDIYALLRRQYKPVELIAIPDGTHALSRPSERMISLQGNVDWHRFWLKGEQRTEPVLLAETAATLRERYLNWQQMARLKQAEDAKPRCARQGDLQ